jgi:hypothetical protein
LDGGKDVLAIDSLSLLVLALFACFAGDEGNELGYALLNSFLGVFGDFGIIGKGLLHNAADVGDRQESRIVGRVSG